MGALPHPTIQKFAVITVAIVGASRRFLAQITRHQNEVKFMSASLQYSNYTGQADFAVPYSIMTAPAARHIVPLPAGSMQDGNPSGNANAGSGKTNHDMSAT